MKSVKKSDEWTPAEKQVAFIVSGLTEHMVRRLHMCGTSFTITRPPGNSGELMLNPDHELSEDDILTITTRYGEANVKLVPPMISPRKRVSVSHSSRASRYPEHDRVNYN